MDSARNAAAASDTVTNFAKALAGHVEGRVVLSDQVSNLALAKCSRVLLLRALNVPMKLRNYWCKRRNSTGARCDKPHGCYGLWHG